MVLPNMPIKLPESVDAILGAYLGEHEVTAQLLLKSGKTIMVVIANDALQPSGTRYSRRALEQIHRHLMAQVVV